MAHRQPRNQESAYRVRLSPTVLTTLVIGLLAEGAIGGFAVFQLLMGISGLGSFFLTVFVIVVMGLLFAASIGSISRDIAAQAGLGFDDHPDIP